MQKAKELIPNPRLSHGQLAMQQTYHHRIWSKIDGVDEGGLLTNTACHTVDLLTYLMDSEPERVYAEAGCSSQRPRARWPGRRARRHDSVENGSLSTVISCDQGFNPLVSKWFHEIWDGERSAVFTEHTGRVDFGGCEVDCVDVGAPTGDERLRVLGPYPMLMSLLEAIRTDGETLCTVRDGVRTVIICTPCKRRSGPAGRKAYRRGDGLTPGPFPGREGGLLPVVSAVSCGHSRSPWKRDGVRAAVRPLRSPAGGGTVSFPPMENAVAARRSYFAGRRWRPAGLLSGASATGQQAPRRIDGAQGCAVERIHVQPLAVGPGDDILPADSQLRDLHVFPAPEAGRRCARWPAVRLVRRSRAAGHPAS